MGRVPCCEKGGLKKGPWTAEEDQKLLAYIDANGHGSWRSLPEKAGLQRCGKSCRLRWTNYLRPDIKRGKFTAQEEQTIIQLHAFLGNRWSAIATHLPKRTDNEIKNHWNTHLKKRLTKMGIDPVTHKVKGNSLDSLHGQTREAVNLSHMAQWESARVEAEARLVRESKFRLESIRIHSEPSLPTQNHQTSCLDILKAWQRLVIRNTSIVDLTTRHSESPTSTLSSIENALTTQNTEENRKLDFLISDNGEMKEWKEFVKLMNTINEERQNSLEFSWLQESSRKFIHGFSDLLVDSSDLKTSENIAIEIGRNINEEENGMSVWNTIFDMTNVVSPNNSGF